MESIEDEQIQNPQLSLPDSIWPKNILSHLTHRQIRFFGATCRQAQDIANHYFYELFKCTSFEAIDLFLRAEKNGVTLNISLLARLSNIDRSTDLFFTLQLEDNPSWGIAAICGDMAWLKKHFSLDEIKKNPELLYFVTLGGHLDIIEEYFLDILESSSERIYYTAGKSGHFHICDKLEEIFHLKPNQKYGNNPESTLHFYAEYGKKERLEKALELYPAADKDNLVLHAAKGGDIETVEFLANRYPEKFKKPEGENQEEDDTTCVHIAAEFGHPELLIRLIEVYHLDPFKPDYVGITPLHHSTTSGRWDCFNILKPLYEAHFTEAQLNEILACAGHYAAGNNKMDFFDDYLKKIGSKVDCLHAKDPNGAPLSHHLLTSKNRLTARKLVNKYRVDLNDTNEIGENVLLMMAKIARDSNLKTLWKFISDVFKMFNRQFNDQLHLIPDDDGITLQDIIISDNKLDLFPTLTPEYKGMIKQ